MSKFKVEGGVEILSSTSKLVTLTYLETEKYHFSKCLQLQVHVFQLNVIKYFHYYQKCTWNYIWVVLSENQALSSK